MTTTTRTTWQRPDLVPLAQRLRYLQLFRAAATAVALTIHLLVGGPGSVAGILRLGAAAIAIGLIAEVTVRFVQRTGRWLFGLVVLGDGVFLAALVQLLGGLGSPSRYLVVLHLVVVTLVASHRTGLKLAIWHSLLALVVHEAAQIGWIPAPAVDDPTVAVATQLALMWALTIVTASASAVNEREILRRRYDLDALARMSASLDHSSSLHEVASTVVAHVCETFDAPRAGIVSLRGGDPVMIAGHGLMPTTGTGAVNGLLAATAAQRRTLLVAGLGEDDGWLAHHLPDAAHLTLIPLTADGVLDDVLVVEHRNRVAGRLERRVVSTIERFAAEGAMALRNARLHAELVALAQTDGLTGVANRVVFDRTLKAELARVERYGGSLALVLCDLDHFKSINDRFGHQVGDEVLIETARTLQTVSREHDVVARYGGEEFAIVMPAATHQTAALIAERLRAAVAESAAPVPVTISVGVAAVEGVASPSQVIGAADQALYAAKRDGRNRVAVTAPPGSLHPSGHNVTG